jgi:hypothetical protein
MGSMLVLFAYVKNKGGNLSTMTQALTFIVSCEKLGLAHPFVGSCWGHDMFKCCQYAINDSKVGLITISTRVTSLLQKTITCTKKSGKGRWEWHKTCLHSGVPPRKLKTPIKIRFASTIILFQKIFGIQAHYCLMLWMTTILGTLRPCAKSTSLGYSPS